MIKNLLIAASLSFALFACGGADCESLCEDAKECDGATDEQKNADCAAQCEAAATQAETAGCTEEYEASIDCAGDQDVCAEPVEGEENPCAEEAAALVACALANAGQ